MLFKSLFKKKITLPAHQENWQQFPSCIHGQQAQITVDLGWAPHAPLANFQEVFYLIIPFDGETPEGLPLAETMELIKALEQQIAYHFKKAELEAVHVASISMRGERLQMYYFHKSQQVQRFVQVLVKAFGIRLTYQTDGRRDKKWEDYFTLAYPSPVQLQLIQDRKKQKDTIDNL